VTDGGTGQNRSALAAVRALAAGGFRPVVTVSGARSLAASSRYAYRTVQVPPVDDDGYADAVRSEMGRAGHAGLLPASDAAVVALDAAGADLVDKAALRRRMSGARLAALPQVECGTRAEVEKAAAELGYPAVVKFAVKSRLDNQPARVVRLASDVAALPATGAFVVQPFVSKPLRALAVVVHSGRLLAAVHQRYLRTWPADAGTASAAVTTTPDEQLEEAALRLLAGYDGIAQLQLVGGYVIDVNPRVYGSLPLAVAAGANLPALWCGAQLGRAPAQLVRGRVGVRYRWLEGDLRSLLHAVRANTVSPLQAVDALRPRRGTAHSVESLRDPAPLAVRLRHAAGRP
jgi:predicted ATP-grasp superfamily ATP-dependent carboligase